MSELISIITPLYNSKDFIESTIKSVLEQTYENWEHIIIDDSSTDGSQDIVKSFSKKESRIKLLHLDLNKGPAIARNKGIEWASGRYIAFLDSDDLWHKEKLEKQISFMQSNCYAFTYTKFEKIDEFGNVIGSVSPYKQDVCYHELLKSNHIGCLTAIVDLKKIGHKVFMPNIRKRQDQGLWLGILKKINKAYCLNDVLAQYRIHSGSISDNKIDNLKYQWQLYRKIEGLGIAESLYYMMFYAYYGFRKYSN